MRSGSASPASGAIGDGDAAPSNGTVAVISCSRIGMTANPPRLTLVDWFRPRRRR
ncbi:hypothetical protein [Mycolicibacterium cosmeticum]|uniref:Uncharacterized protein n=1 Tax=Mycolicibacterium cosmeticum TaxID=258533 RepID=W9BHI1_MYCCO|nr:hypothetical protein [Mycolicibacterium cosmeticum]CDO06065.1 hypothetical protein BN977_00846 [Mycolicibacterium cosmeticum]